MKERPILISVIILTLIVELVLIILVYEKIGGDRLPSQIGRLIFQLICISFILIRKSNIALFLLSGFHIITALFFLFMNASPDLTDKMFGFYHIGIGLIIYFHDWIENKLKIKNVG